MALCAQRHRPRLITYEQQAPNGRQSGTGNPNAMTPTPYLIILVGSGTHHQGNLNGNPAKDADHHLKNMVAALQAAGHNLDGVAFIAENSPPEMLVGTPDKLPTIGGESKDAVTLDTVHKDVLEVKAILKRFREGDDKKKKKGAETSATTTEPPEDANQQPAASGDEAQSEKVPTTTTEPA